MLQVKHKPTASKLEGVKKLTNKGLLTVLQSEDLNSMNTFDQPQNVAPKESSIEVEGKKILLNSAPYSFSVIRVKYLRVS